MSFNEAKLEQAFINLVEKQGYTYVPASDLYDSNKAFLNILSNGFVLQREQHKKKC